MKEFNIVLAGVGGQGILLAAEILGTAAVNDGLNVRVGEIHGMAQRGGAVL
ncbi:MAG: 2-oxoacid:acceptor oxidoreductase family protein, partial [Candidatus Bathyarchaeia archaeon]